MNCVKKKKTDLYERIISQIKISVFLIFSKKCSYSRLYKEEGEKGMKKLEKKDEMYCEFR